VPKREFVLTLLLIATALLMGRLSPVFLQPGSLLDMTRHMVEVGLVALPMTLVILTAGIDLSPGSTMGLASVVLGLAWRGGLPIGVAAGLALFVAAACGALNGALVAAARLPALIVTVATLAIYRGLALGLGRGGDVSGYPESFYLLGQSYIGGWVPAQTLVFALLALAAAIFLDRTAAGRSLRAVGANEAGARLSGVPTARYHFLVYTLTGLMAGLAAIIYAARVSTAKADAGAGLELDAITAVVLGGTSISGGEGGIGGTVLGLLLITTLTHGLTLARIPSDRQAVLLGLLLLGAVWLDRRLRRG
jgi:ribose/xylose/arabinose/galactoside ABC-type transport system permease subunit